MSIGRATVPLFLTEILRGFEAMSAVAFPIVPDEWPQILGKRPREAFPVGEFETP